MDLSNVTLLLLYAFSSQLLVNICAQNSYNFTNIYYMAIRGGILAASDIAKKEELKLEGKLEPFENIYEFSNDSHPNAENLKLKNNVKKYGNVYWYQQTVLKPISIRSITCPRSLGDGQSRYKNTFNDELWPDQWYSQDCRTSTRDGPIYDINVVPVYAKYNIYGRGVVVVVVDDGVEVNHPDLRHSFDRYFGLDLVRDKFYSNSMRYSDDPTPVHETTRDHSHGTRCAGEIAMKADNAICGAGVAPLVTLGAVRLIGPTGTTDDGRVSRALSFKHKEVSIVSNSWGSPDDGRSMNYLGQLTKEAILKGIREGRNGKGIIYVFAGGNGKGEGDNCACDPYVTTIHTIAVASANHLGKIFGYSERCSSILVTAYSGAGSGDNYNIATTDVNEGCTTHHTGTSAAAPLVAGVVALALEANPSLTWRCVQHLLVWTSQIFPLQNNYGTWKRNAAGIYFSNDFGAGMINGDRLVTAARNFKPVPPMLTCIVIPKPVRDYTIRKSGAQIVFPNDGCVGQSSEINYVEHVQLKITINYSRRGDLRINLQSPLGTSSRILDPRPPDNFRGQFTWVYDSVHFWGESAAGEWKVNIFDTGPRENNGFFQWAHLIIYGTKEMPDHYKNGPRSYSAFTLPDKPFNRPFYNMPPQTLANDWFSSLNRYSSIFNI